jgi:hypothetical protein
VPESFAAKISVENEQIWQAELRIPAGLIDGWESEIGLGLWAERPQTGTAANAYWPHLPLLAIPDEPARWAHTILVDAPVLDDVQPAVDLAGSDQLNLTLSGRNFAEDAQVLWQGDPLSATRSSPTEMVATVDSAALAEAGSFSVHVQNEELPQFPSNARLVTLLNPQPVITTLSPDQVDAGTDALLLTIEGQGFVNGAVVKWDGVSKATTYISPTELRAVITTLDLSLGGNIAVTVANPDPAQGVSRPAFFRVEPNPDAVPVRPLYMPAIMGG